MTEPKCYNLQVYYIFVDETKTFKATFSFRSWQIRTRNFFGWFVIYLTLEKLSSNWMRFKCSQNEHIMDLNQWTNLHIS